MPSCIVIQRDWDTILAIVARSDVLPDRTRTGSVTVSLVARIPVDRNAVVASIGPLVEADREALWHSIFGDPATEVIVTDVDALAISTGSVTSIHLKPRCKLEV
ncbi:hypothetical protein N9K45_00390 [bacterium]|nr:hypothetical protein [bacterium]